MLKASKFAMRLLEFKGEKKEYEEDYITFCASKIC